ncbi:SH3 and cysteine-rich domain-containing protein, partial [Sarcoptes scabiei]
DSDAHESLTIVKSKQRENDEFLKENEILQQTTDEKITKPDSMQKNVSKKLSIKQDSKDLEFYEFDDVNSKLYEKEYSETNVSQLIRLRSQSTNQDQYVENIFRCRSAPDFDETEVSATIEKIVKKYSEISTEIIIKQRSKPTESIVESEPCVVILPAKPQTYQIEEASAELKIVIDSLEYRYLSSKMIDELVCNQSYSSAVPSVISLRKGDRIYVVERVNQDWWFVRKKITNEFGFAPAEFIIDDTLSPFSRIRA